MFHGADVRRLVEEVTDDKSLPKAERKRLQIEHAAHISPAGLYWGIFLALIALTGVTVGISYVDRDGRFRFSNRTYDDWFGIAEERMLGRTAAEVFGVPLGEVTSEQRRYAKVINLSAEGEPDIEPDLPKQIAITVEITSDGPIAGPQSFAPNTFNRGTQPVSPYLNLLNSTNPALTYYYGVRPGTQGSPSWRRRKRCRIKCCRTSNRGTS